MNTSPNLPPADENGIHWWHRIRLPDGSYTPGAVFYGPDGGDWPTQRFGLPRDLTGLSVLDVGAWDGFFSFEAERRGAKEVIAVDIPLEEGGNWGGTEGFRFAKRKLDSKVQYKPLNIENVTGRWVWKADVVLCYGVLYHLKSPLIAMENLAYLTKDGGTCIIETATSPATGAPCLQYEPGHDGDPTNYFYPNDQWIYVAAGEVGFKTAEKMFDGSNRATYRLTK